MVAAVHQEEHPAGAAVLDQAVDRRDGGDRVAGASGQLDQGPRPGSRRRESAACGHGRRGSCRPRSAPSSPGGRPRAAGSPDRGG